MHSISRRPLAASDLVKFVAGQPEHAAHNYQALVSVRPPCQVVVEFRGHSARSAAYATAGPLTVDELDLGGVGQVVLADVDALWYHGIAEVGWLFRRAVAGLVPGGALRVNALCAGGASDWAAAARSVLSDTEWCPSRFDGPDIGQLAQIVVYSGATVAEAETRWGQTDFSDHDELADWAWRSLGWRWLARVPASRRGAIFAAISARHAKKARGGRSVVDLVAGTVTACKPTP